MLLPGGTWQCGVRCTMNSPSKYIGGGAVELKGPLIGLESLRGCKIDPGGAREEGVRVPYNGR